VKTELLYDSVRQEAMTPRNGQGESDTTSDDEESDEGYDNETLAEAAYSSVVDCIDGLLKLSMAVRRPSMRTGLSKGHTFRKVDEETAVDLFDCFTAFDQDYIRSYLQTRRQDTAGPVLIQRLSEANNKRRRQFAYWAQRKLNLVRRTANTVSMLASEQQKQDLDLPIQPSSAYSRPTTATQLDPTRVNIDEDAQSVISTVSMSMTELVGNDDDMMVFPDPPDEYLKRDELKEFECPYCYTICSRRTLNVREWR
jgi:hypothetical protein